MARVGIVVGIVLCGLTFVAMVGIPTKSPTLFVPMMLGIPVLFCGVVALNPHRRKHAMNFASGIAVVGLIAGVVRSIYSLLQLAGGTEIDRYGLAVIGAMSVICAILVVICLVSFIQTRRRKAASAPDRSVSSISIVDTVMEDDQVSGVKPRESA